MAKRATRGIKKQELEGFYLIQKRSGCSRNHWFVSVKYGLSYITQPAITSGCILRVLHSKILYQNCLIFGNHDMNLNVEIPLVQHTYYTNFLDFLIGSNLEANVYYLVYSPIL